MCSANTFYASDVQRLAISPEEAFVLDFTFTAACVTVRLLQVMVNWQHSCMATDRNVAWQFDLIVNSLYMPWDWSALENMMFPRM